MSDTRLDSTSAVVLTHKMEKQSVSQLDYLSVEAFLLDADFLRHSDSSLEVLMDKGLERQSDSASVLMSVLTSVLVSVLVSDSLLDEGSEWLMGFLSVVESAAHTFDNPRVKPVLLGVLMDAVSVDHTVQR